MGEYTNASNEAMKLIIACIRLRMKEKGVSQTEIAEILEVNRATITRWFDLSNPMPLPMYLEVCGILDLRHYLIQAEDDQNEMKRLFFN